jgi:hypothetical protein
MCGAAHFRLRGQVEGAAGRFQKFKAVGSPCHPQANGFDKDQRELGAFFRLMMRYLVEILTPEAKLWVEQRR